MTAAFNDPPCSNNKYLCILDDVATHARAITNQLTLFCRKKGNHSASRASEAVLIFGERKRKIRGSLTSGQTAPDRIVSELWNTPIMAYESLI